MLLILETLPVITTALEPFVLFINKHPTTEKPLLLSITLPRGYRSDLSLNSPTFPALLGFDSLTRLPGGVVEYLLDK